MLNDANDMAIVDGVLRLAKAFNRDVIAEGVETIEHGKLLLQLGCNNAQGYCIARPMSAEQVINWIQDWQPVAIWNDIKEVHADDLPVLIAGTEHRRWIYRIAQYIEDKSEKLPPLDHHT